MSIPPKVVKPIAISEAMLVSTNVPETDYEDWHSATTYAIGDRAIRGHKVWESQQSANLNNDPTSAPLFWVEVSPTNRWKAFDTSNSTQTAQAGSITYTLRPPTSLTAFAALNLAGTSSLQIQVMHATYGTLYDRTVNMASLPVATGWWEFLFGERMAPTQAILLDLPGMPNADIVITLSGGDNLAVGVLMVGQIRKIGEGTRAGVRIGFQDFSRKRTNDYGDTFLYRGAFANRLSFDVLLTSAQIDSTVRLRSELRSTPCLWIASTLCEATTIFGFFNEFNVVIPYRFNSECSIEIEGLT